MATEGEWSSATSSDFGDVEDCYKCDNDCDGHVQALCHTCAAHVARGAGSSAGGSSSGRRRRRRSTLSISGSMNRLTGSTMRNQWRLARGARLRRRISGRRRLESWTRRRARKGSHRSTASGHDLQCILSRFRMSRPLLGREGKPGLAEILEVLNKQPLEPRRLTTHLGRQCARTVGGAQSRACDGSEEKEGGQRSPYEGRCATWKRGAVRRHADPSPLHLRGGAWTRWIWWGNGRTMLRRLCGLPVTQGAVRRCWIRPGSCARTCDCERWCD